MHVNFQTNDQVALLLESIQNSDAIAFDSLVVALYNTQQNKIADMLREEEFKLKKEMNFTSTGKVDIA